MTRVLLTGGSGFIAAHVLESLLKRGHSVVTTVRSQEKASRIKAAYPDLPSSKLDFAIVEDIAQPTAFDKAVISNPPFEAVIHTASPFHFNAKDIKKDLIDPAVIGTTGILKSIKASAPTVKRVVVTSSFATIVDGSKGNWPEHTYTEADWSPLTLKEALENQSNGYRGSKALAEKAAWNFVETEKPNFDLVTANPPMVFGPVVHFLNDLNALNTSNERVRNAMRGDWKEKVPETGIFVWIDVRDLALAHVKAIEVPEAGGKRFFITSGYFSNREIADVIRAKFPEYKDQIAGPEVPGGTKPAELFKIDNSRTKKILGLEFTPFEQCMTDLVNSLKKVGA